MALFFQYYDNEIYRIDNQSLCSCGENMHKQNAVIKSEYRSCTNIPIQMCDEVPCPPNEGGEGDNGGGFSGGWQIGHLRKGVFV